MSVLVSIPKRSSVASLSLPGSYGASLSRQSLVRKWDPVWMAAKRLIHRELCWRDTGDLLLWGVMFSRKWRKFPGLCWITGKVQVGVCPRHSCKDVTVKKKAVLLPCILPTWHDIASWATHCVPHIADTNCSLLFIIPHRDKNLGTFQVWLLCCSILSFMSLT